MDNNSSDYSTGIETLDEILQMILPGDNLVWQIDSIKEYQTFVCAFAEEAAKRKKKLVYFRFAGHPSLLPSDKSYMVKHIDPTLGFERFTIEILKVIRQKQLTAWYVFDCLSDLPVHWYSDLMLGNFFVLICPYVLQIKSLAYFALIRNRHSISVVSQIRNTTQILIDVFRYHENLYIQPLKVDQRRSPTMYLPHRMEQNRFFPVTDSATISEVASILTNGDVGNTSRVLDVWERTFLSAHRTAVEIQEGDLSEEIYALLFKKLLNMVLSQDETILMLAEQYLGIQDILEIKKRLIGTGRIGGKSVGMLLARAILQHSNPRWAKIMEIHDSFYIGSDVYYTFIVQNDCWDMRQKQHDKSTFLNGIDEAREKILNGVFPPFIIEQFIVMLDYYGQSPIIVRSSSLLEDNYGNAFSGKYDSIFCTNQGSREERLRVFLDAVRHVYASTVSREALEYRSQRDLLDSDEQMALLVQRVSGAVHGQMFMPHVAGVGYSFNPYAWSSKINPASGVLRLVSGLGTRAVDRHDDDYTRIVALNEPKMLPEKSLNTLSRYSQSQVDVLDLRENVLRTVNFDRVALEGTGFPLHIVATRIDAPPQYDTVPHYSPWVISFEELISDTAYIDDMQILLHTLQDAYHSPVDVEFTTNFREDGTYQINLVQCRPLQLRMEGGKLNLPRKIKQKNRIFDIHGAIIGANRIVRLDRIIYIVPEKYSTLKDHERYEVAKLIGRLLHIKGSSTKTTMLMGPGRWGTSMPSLGIPVGFADINTVSVLFEMVTMHDNLIPDVSLGTHFFNDIVEADIAYMALFPKVMDNYLNVEFLENEPNQLATIAPVEAGFAHIVRVIDAAEFPITRRIILYVNTMEQWASCYLVDGNSNPFVK